MLRHGVADLRWPVRLVRMNAVSSSRDWASRFARLIGLAVQPIDNVVLVLVRVAVAAAIYVWADSFLSDDRYRAIFVDARVLMKYTGLQWIGVWPGDGMRWHFVVTKIAAVGLGIGLLTRLCAIKLFASVAYVLLVERAIYVNHYYLLSIAAGLLAILPAGSRWSVDSLIGLTRRQATMPRWFLWLLRFQLGIPYFFGAIAKLNGDWFRGQPAEMILRGQTDWFGRPWSEFPGAVGAMVYGGFAYDLLIVPMLIWKPTRLIAVMMSLAFHLTNAYTLRIGVFPWFMLATLVVFFPPETLGAGGGSFWDSRPMTCRRRRSCRRLGKIFRERRDSRWRHRWCTSACMCVCRFVQCFIPAMRIGTSEGIGLRGG